MSRKHRRKKTSRGILTLATLLLVTCVVAVALVLTRSHGLKAAERTPSPEPSFLPTNANNNPAPNAAPENMVWIPGGEFSMGAQDPRGVPEGGMQSMDDARP